MSRSPRNSSSTIPALRAVARLAWKDASAAVTGFRSSSASSASRRFQIATFGRCVLSVSSVRASSTHAYAGARAHHINSSRVVALPGPRRATSSYPLVALLHAETAIRHEPPRFCPLHRLRSGFPNRPAEQRHVVPAVQRTPGWRGHRRRRWVSVHNRRISPRHDRPASRDRLGASLSSRAWRRRPIWRNLLRTIRFEYRPNQGGDFRFQRCCGVF